MGFGLIHLQPLHEPAVLLLGQLSRLALAAGPLEGALFQPLIQQHEPVPLPIQGLDPIPFPSAEQEQGVGEGIQLELGLHQSGEAVDAPAQIRVPAGEIDAVCAGEVIQHDSAPDRQRATYSRPRPGEPPRLRREDGAQPPLRRCCVYVPPQTPFSAPRPAHRAGAANGSSCPG